MQIPKAFKEFFHTKNTILISVIFFAFVCLLILLYFTIYGKINREISYSSYHPYTTGTPGVQGSNTYTTGTPSVTQAEGHTSNNIAQNLSSCSGNGYLTASPLSTSAYTSIDPLGHLNPPFHNLPDDHPGFQLATTGYGSNIKSLPETVYAPGDATILEIDNQSVTSSTGTINDYLITFAPCNELVFYLGHVSTLSNTLLQQINNVKGQYKSCQVTTEKAATSNVCQYFINFPIKAGEVLGTAGGNVLGMDFGAYDLRTTPLAFIDQTRNIQGSDRYLHTVCPFDYYSNVSVQNQLYAKIQNTQKGSNGLPSCGTDMEDVPNTLAGNWYVHPFSGIGADNWSEQLSFSHWETNPDIQALVYGGTVVPNGAMIIYNPKTSGYVNRMPNQVTADGQIYCYYQDNFTTDYGQSPQDGGHFIVQLINSTTMKIEFQSGSCPIYPKFNNPTTYIR